MLKHYLVLLFLLLPLTTFADVRFTSPLKQTTFLELYTSEGCSSCPPADRWLSSLKNDPRLWEEIIPVAFHVDYWDYLGWKDAFSKAEYTQRQRNYARWHNLGTIYTPGFVKNGKEWRGWYRDRTVGSSDKQVGQLTVNISQDIVTANFKPVVRINEPVILNVAWLGFDLETEIQAGENEGKKLKHDFVSFKNDTLIGNIVDDSYSWKFKTNFTGLPVNRGAAFWITGGENPTPIQATGGML